MSKHKFASNVVEKALVNSAPADRRDLVQELIGLRSDGTNNVAMLLKDAYANFPVQASLSPRLARSELMGDRRRLCTASQRTGSR